MQHSTVRFLTELEEEAASPNPTTLDASDYTSGAILAELDESNAVQVPSKKDLRAFSKADWDRFISSSK